MQHEQHRRGPSFVGRPTRAAIVFTAAFAAILLLLAACASVAQPARAWANVGDDGYTESAYSPTLKTSYAIYYHLNGGDQPKGQVKRVFKDQKLSTSELKKPTRTGYAFVGWYTSSSLKTAATSVTGTASTAKRTVYAKWNKTAAALPKGTYSITYRLDGGKQASGQRTTFTKSTATFALKAPSKPLHTFAGWYADSAKTKRIAKVSKGTAKNLTLYAKWKWKGSDYVFFGQNDKSSTWYKLPYWSGRTIGGSGCGLVSYTMAINILTRSSCTPYDMYYLRGGEKGSWKGTDLTAGSTRGQLESTPLTHSQFSEKYFGVKQVTMKKLDFSTAAKKKSSVSNCIESMKDGLLKGYVYLITRGGGKCFKNSDGVWEHHNAHYVLIYRYNADTNTFYVHDPSGNTQTTISKHRAVKYSQADMEKCVGFRAGYIGYLYKAA